MSRKRSDEVIQTAEYVTIGELVRLTGVRYSTLKYYTEEGFLHFEQEEENLTRRYQRVQAIREIEEMKRMRSEGLSIEQIRQKRLEKKAGT
ncbi:MAG: helix-turn-helix domain-containing protein [Acetatifactor sp.]|nr:helix-turn-helix domain-containing protein [Acetatifactor sp.]